MEIIGFALEPHPVRRPLLLVVVSTVALLHKMLLQLWLTWDQQQQQQKQEKEESESHLEVNHKGSTSSRLEMNASSLGYCKV